MATTGVYFEESEARTVASITRTRLPITSTIMRMLASVGTTSWYKYVFWGFLTREVLFAGLDLDSGIWNLDSRLNSVYCSILFWLAPARLVGVEG